MEQRMKKFFLLGFSLLFLFLASCDQGIYTKGVQGAGIGAAGGAILGQAIGRNTGGTLIGATLGGLIGYIVGNEMDGYDRQKLNNAYEYGQSGKASAWHNPDTGNSYKVIPQHSYTSPGHSHRICRRAKIITTIDGKRERTYTTACRNSNGEWILHNS